MRCLAAHKLPYAARAASDSCIWGIDHSSTATFWRVQLPLQSTKKNDRLHHTCNKQEAATTWVTRDDDASRRLGLLQKIEQHIEHLQPNGCIGMDQVNKMTLSCGKALPYRRIVNKLQPKMCSSSLRSSVELSNEICAPQVGLGHQSRDGIVVRQHRGVCQPQAGLVDRCEQRGRDGGGGSWWGEQAGSSITCECKEGSAGRELVTLLEHPGTAAAVCSPLPAHLWEGSTRVRHNAREVCRPRLEQRP